MRNPRTPAKSRRSVASLLDWYEDIPCSRRMQRISALINYES
jgi:hypothetical protein